MGEEAEIAESGTGAGGHAIDPAAIAVALGSASRERADAFLEEQSILSKEQSLLTRKQAHLVDLQAKELAHELKLRHWSLQLRHASAILKFALDVSLALIGVAIACFIGVVVWNAAHADGLVVESFSVPPELAARGLTGQVVASRMLDRLTEMQNATGSTRAPQSYANDWGNDIKVEVPEIGVSFGEVYRFLRTWLGHETHLTGEVYRTGSGIAITARTGGDSGATFTGSEADFGALVQKAAEYVYGQTQPFRYASYLRAQFRSAEAIPFEKFLAENGSTPLDQAEGYTQWAVDAGQLYGIDRQISLLERGAALGTDLPGLWQIMGRVEINRSQPEEALSDLKKALLLDTNHGDEFYAADQVPLMKEFVQALIDQQTGNFQESSRKFADVVQGGLKGTSDLVSYLAEAQAGEHELSLARTSTANGAETGSSQAVAILGSTRAKMLIDVAAQNWAGILSDMDAYAPILQRYPGERTNFPRMTVPFTAYAEARLDRIIDAEKDIAATPADCYDCLITRARIAEIEGQHARADWWFGRAVSNAPSIPFAYTYWGQGLLERGDPDAAISKFTLANQKGPKFADPLEMWGEALMKKNRSDLALAKFEEANKYAPNWGRLHLKWGEALGYAGRKDEAQKQYVLAAGLNLYNDDKAELTKVSHG